MKPAREFLAAGSLRLVGLREPEGMGNRKAEVNDNRARWYGQHERSTAKLRWRFDRTVGEIRRGGQPFDHLKQCIRDAIFKRRAYFRAFAGYVKVTPLRSCDPAADQPWQPDR